MSRIQSIDALRGLVMILMLLDHVRETYYLHEQVADPVDVASTDPALIFLRLLSSLCAPVFVLLTGLGAWLYGRSHTKGQVAAFLLKRGLFLIVLELTVINFAWTTKFPPTTIYLQVIWVIGLSMIALAGLLYLPRIAQILAAILLVAAHHVLESVQVDPSSIWSAPWAILYDRSWLELGENLRARTSYPLLPWIGIILIGYLIGPWFSSDTEEKDRIRTLVTAGAACLVAFIVLRWLNIYGDAPRLTGEDADIVFWSFLSLTKYPPSLLFSLSTLGAGLLLLAAFERMGNNKALTAIAIFGAAPMFFYILHLYVLKALYRLTVAILGTNQGDYFGFSSVGPLWLVTLALAIALYFPTAWFARLKRRRPDITALKYF